MATISLCMIVRDEEAMLGACLASARGVVDEMIVVDTGSRDATKSIAERAGARVYDFAWCDDFAAARNEALRHARSEWVLVLDADERITRASGRGIHAAVRRGGFDCGMLRLHDAARLDASLEEVASGVARQAEIQLVPRLLRRTDGLTYSGAIHESVLGWLRRRGMKVTGVDGDVVHYGATQAVVDAKSKIERNIRMLRARLQRDPGDLSLHGYLAHDLLRAGFPAEARAAAEVGWSMVDVTGDAQELQIHRLATARAYLQIRAGEYADARETLRVARAADGDNPDFCFLSACASESEALCSTEPARKTLLAEAREGYRACARFAGRVFAQSFVFGATSWSGSTRLGTVELVLGAPHEALRAFEKALEARPGDREARLGRSEAMIELGDAPGALGSLESLLDDSSPDAWTLAAVAVARLGLWEDARLFARRAQSLLDKGFLARHRRDRLRGVVTSLSAAAVSQA
jgi:tetratricopeptide (TPR) repeat protein